ncbi:MAG: DNA helicase PcrA [Lachnospiraceae bacterium]|nr:DNA helicase PcrA [Lachnospiraceae bacterium]
MNLLDKLNPVQRTAAMHTEGPLLILAGAGSGKTRVLTHRIAYMIEKGISPYNILAITFTNKAAKEMKERVNALVGNDAVWVSTFHSTCVRILRREIHHINYDNSFTIYDADDSLKLIKDCIKEANINEKQFPPKSVQAVIGGEKDKLVTAEEFERKSQSDYRLSQISKVYSLYQKRLKSNNALDFDDIIFLTVKLFTARPDILEKYQNRFQYIMVDEYQDTNFAQYSLIKLLSSKSHNLCVVGDDDQSIYGWRGADISNILDFEKDFKNATVIKLEQNYRSTQNILTAANAVINNNISRKNKVLWTENEEGRNINFYKASNDLEEAQFICEKIEEHKNTGGSYNDMAVLYRQNSLSRSVEDMLVKSNIPYKIYGGVRFYDRKEVKDVLAYLKAIYNPFDDVAFKRIINTPKRGIGDTTANKISEYAIQNEMSFFDAMKNPECLLELGTRAKRIEEFINLMEELKSFAYVNMVSEVIEYVMEKTGYIKELETEGTDEARSRIENIEELMNKAGEFEESSEDKTLSAFLEEVSLVADIDGFDDSSENVSLMTLHSSKGLEFPIVFIAGFEENIFPSYRSMFSGDLSDLEEERRLCYVGITRAENSLYLTSASQRMQHGQIVCNLPSRFLKEIPINIIDRNMQESKSKFEASGNIGKMAPVNAKENMKSSFGGKNYRENPIPAPKNITLDFEIGDKVKQMKYGVGTVKDIRPAGADYEVSIEFPGVGVKKFMAHFSNLKKA